MSRNYRCLIMKRRSGLVLLGLVFVLAAAAFESPDEEDRRQAVGELRGLKPSLKRAFSDEGEFSPKKEPSAMDWLASHNEPGQGFDQYVRSKPNLPFAERRKLYVLPLGEFDPETAPSLEALKSYTAAYFHPLEVKMLPSMAVPDGKVRSRINSGSGKRQINSRDVISWMKGRLPADAYAMLAVTMTDLYPEESWNFVFGQASIKRRVGVFSFARYHPRWTGRPADDKTQALVMRRAAKVLTHEMGHMFGIRHCIHYECNMNGANHLGEADSTPMHLCPVCLRKLWYGNRFDPVERYGKLQAFYRENDLDAEEEWVGKRMESLKKHPISSKE